VQHTFRVPQKSRTLEGWLVVAIVFAMLAMLWMAI